MVVRVTRAARRWLLVAVSALLAAWVIGPATVPIYDGPQAPDEPYRYVHAPAGVTNSSKQPTVASMAVPVVNGKNRAEYINSGEFGPQIDIFLPAGALGAPAGVQTVRVTATPLAPTSPLPTDGTIVTNVYRVTATANGRAVPIVGKQQQAVFIQMRAPNSNQPGPVFERRTSSGWQRYRTIRSGNDIYETSDVTQLGDWALVKLAGSGATTSSGVNGGLLGAGVAVLVLAGVILAIRIRRTRAVAP
jgi:hypothetical protein